MYPKSYGNLQINARIKYLHPMENGNHDNTVRQ
jgi:hypothetical protein